MAPTVDRVRDALAERCVEMEREAPEALDLAAEVIAALHAHLAGRATGLAGTRSPKYRREQLRGEKCIAVEDLAWLALNAPTALASALGQLARPTGYRVVAEDVAGPDTVTEATAAMVESTSIVFAGVTRALEDGRIDQHEAAVLDREAEKSERRLAALRKALDARRGNRS